MRKVLVVDDEKLIVKGIKFSLEQDEMQVDCAYDGEEALEKAKENQYDIILLDVMLPGLTGFEVCQAIREFSSVPIIMLTAKGEDMDKKKQMHAPVYEALEKLKKRRVVPFDVPGHKRGRGNPELVELLGEKCVSLDVNSMKPLDNLCHPVSVIKEAEELAAEAFRADHAFFMVGGTTSSVQGMVLSCCKAGDKIILPRNVHKSVINALVLCGAIPVYVNPEVNAQLGISLGMEVSQVEKAMDENPDAVAVLVNNPTYYGICSDLRTIVKKAHARVGYKAAKQGKKLVLSLGYSHPVEMEDPDGIETKVDGNKIIVSGISKEKVGQFAAEIRDKRRPEPYKGKGIKYVDEVIRRKVGKTGKK